VAFQAYSRKGGAKKSEEHEKGKERLDREKGERLDEKRPTVCE
jgi:hypothetical protein